ncbi:hypothetical protein F4703DRAFT_1983079 [Phycomyces blakesleeanus]
MELRNSHKKRKRSLSHSHDILNDLKKIKPEHSDQNKKHDNLHTTKLLTHNNDKVNAYTSSHSCKPQAFGKPEKETSESPWGNRKYYGSGNVEDIVKTDDGVKTYVIRTTRTAFACQVIDGLVQPPKALLIREVLGSIKKLNLSNLRNLNLNLNLNLILIPHPHPHPHPQQPQPYPQQPQPYPQQPQPYPQQPQPYPQQPQPYPQQPQSRSEHPSGLGDQYSLTENIYKVIEFDPKAINEHQEKSYIYDHTPYGSCLSEGPNPRRKPKTKRQTNPEPEPEPRPRTQARAKPKGEPFPEPKPRRKPGPKPKGEPKPKPQPRPKGRPKRKPRVHIKTTIPTTLSSLMKFKIEDLPAYMSDDYPIHTFSEPPEKSSYAKLPITNGEPYKVAHRPVNDLNGNHQISPDRTIPNPQSENTVNSLSLVPEDVVWVPQTDLLETIKSSGQKDWIYINPIKRVQPRYQDVEELEQDNSFVRYRQLFESTRFEAESFRLDSSLMARESEPAFGQLLKRIAFLRQLRDVDWSYKTIYEVCVYLSLLESEAKKFPVLSDPLQEKDPKSEFYIPFANEMSDDWINIEEAEAERFSYAEERTLQIEDAN